MTTAANNGGGTAPAPGVSADDVRRLIAEGVQQALPGAVEQALSAQRERSASIRTCEEATGREVLAAHLADNTDMSIDAAKAVLKAATKVESSGPNNRQAPSAFGSAMDNTPNPNVRADGEGDGQGDGTPTPEATANRLLDNYNHVTGRPVKLIGGTDTRAA